jgi:hypothetical protein
MDQTTERRRRGESPAELKARLVAEITAARSSLGASAARLRGAASLPRMLAWAVPRRLKAALLARPLLAAGAMAAAGFAVARRLRRRPPAAALAVPPAPVSRPFLAGVAAILLKPLAKELILSAVREFRNRRAPTGFH